MTKRLVFMDTETTGIAKRGLPPNEGHRIIEICLYVVDYDGTKLKAVYAPWTRRVDPQRPIDEAAFAVHGIDNRAVMGLPTFDKILPTVHRVIEQADYLIAHNLDFDAQFLVQEYELAKVKFPGDTMGFCTMDKGRLFTAMGKQPNLGELCWATGVAYNPSEAHSAEYDTLCLAEAFGRGLTWGYFTLPTPESAQEAA